MTDDRIPPELEDDLRALRETPREEFTRDLDRHAAEGIARTPSAFRPRPWMGAAAGALAAAAVVIVVAGGGGGGGERLGVAAVPDSAGPSAPSGGAAGDQASPSAEAAPKSAAPQRDAKPQAAPLLLKRDTVSSGEPLVVRYGPGPQATAQISLGARSATTRVPGGSGRITVSTRGVPAGAKGLRVKLRGAQLQMRVVIR